MSTKKILWGTSLFLAMFGTAILMNSSMGNELTTLIEWKLGVRSNLATPVTFTALLVLGTLIIGWAFEWVTRPPRTVD